MIFINISFFLLEKPFIASSDSESDDNDYEQMQRAHLIEQSLLTPSADQALGEWEKHTKVWKICKTTLNGKST